MATTLVFYPFRTFAWLVVAVSLLVLSSGCRVLQVIADGHADNESPSRDAAVEDADPEADSAMEPSEAEAGIAEDGGPVDAGTSTDGGTDAGEADAGQADAGQAADAGDTFDAGQSGDASAPIDPEGWHVDSVAGSDANDGRSPSTAFATLAKLRRSPLLSGDVVYLARGSTWREELVGLPPASVVRAYGKGARPIIDAADVADKSSFRKTDGFTNVYEIAWTHQFGPDGGKSAHRVWEDGVRLRRVADLAACESIPGSFFAGTPTAGGPDTIYVHAADSSNPSSNEHMYELSRRRFAVQLYEHRNHASVYSVHTRRTAHADGTLVVDGLVSDCLAEDGRVHNVFIRGVAEDTTAWKIEPPTVYGGATMFVSYEDRTDLPGVIYRRCNAITDPDAMSANGATNRELTIGFYGHTNLGRKFGTVVYEECETSGVVTGYGFKQVDNLLYYKSRTLGGQIAIGSYPVQTLAVLGGSYRAQGANASIIRFSDDYGVPAKIIVRGVRSVVEGNYAMPLFIDRANGSIEISRSTFVQKGSAILWLRRGTFLVENNLFFGNNFTFRIGSTGVTYASDRNLYFETSMVPAAFQIDMSNVSGLPAWRANTGQDQSSFDADPMFLGSPTMGEFAVAADSPVWALGAGADYEGEERDAVLQGYRATLMQTLEGP